MQFGHYILQFGQIHLAIWTNTFLNLDKYIFKFGQIYFAISTSIFASWTKTNTLPDIEPQSHPQPITLFLLVQGPNMQFGLEHFAIWTNTFGKFD